MSIFDLLFIALFLTTVVTLLTAAVLAIGGRGSRALGILRRLSIFAAVYMGAVAITSAFWPRTVMRTGERRCFDDWCIAIENAARQPSGNAVAYTINIQVSSRARRVYQRENGVVVYLADSRGHRYDPIPKPSDIPISVRLGPGDAVALTRSFEVPADAHDVNLIVSHEGGFPIGWFIIGYETWFHKPAILRLP